MSVPRCQSKNRRPGGCGDPRCPETIYLTNAMNAAIQRGDINAYFRAASISPSNRQGYDVLTVESPVKQKTLFGTKVQRTDLLVPSLNPVQFINKNDVPLLPNYQALMNHVEKIYGKEVQLNILNDYPVSGITCLSSLIINKQSRGMGAGTHVISMFTKIADLKNTPAVLVPAVNETGKTPTGPLSPAEVAYRDRLVTYYRRFGFKLYPELQQGIFPPHIGAILTKSHTMVRLPRGV